MSNNVAQAPISLRDMIAFIRVQIRRGRYSVREDMGVATCPAELMMNIDAILDAAEQGCKTLRVHEDGVPG